MVPIVVPAALCATWRAPAGAPLSNVSNGGQHLLPYWPTSEWVLRLGS